MAAAIPCSRRRRLTRPRPSQHAPRPPGLQLPACTAPLPPHRPYRRRHGSPAPSPSPSLSPSPVAAGRRPAARSAPRTWRAAAADGVVEGGAGGKSRHFRAGRAAHARSGSRARPLPEGGRGAAGGGVTSPQRPGGASAAARARPVPAGDLRTSLGTSSPPPRAAWAAAAGPSAAPAALPLRQPRGRWGEQQYRRSPSPWCPPGPSLARGASAGYPPAPPGALGSSRCRAWPFLWLSSMRILSAPSLQPAQGPSVAAPPSIPIVNEGVNGTGSQYRPPAGPAGTGRHPDPQPRGPPLCHLRASGFIWPIQCVTGQWDIWEGSIIPLIFPIMLLAHLSAAEQ